MKKDLYLQTFQSLIDKKKKSYFSLSEKKGIFNSALPPLWIYGYANSLVLFDIIE